MKTSSRLNHNYFQIKSYMSFYTFCFIVVVCGLELLCCGLTFAGKTNQVAIIPTARN